MICIEDRKSLTSPISLTSLRQPPRGREPISDGQTCFGVDGLPGPIDDPKPVCSRVAANGRIAALLEPIGYLPPVLPVPQPPVEIAGSLVLHPHEGGGVRVAEPIEHVR